MKKSNFVDESISIQGSSEKIWDIITHKKYAIELGTEFDKNAFVESDWKLGSEVHFKYLPDRLVSTGKIGKWIKNELIRVDYNFSGFEYVEQYSIKSSDSDKSVLSIYAGPYNEDLEAQKVVWKNWLNKVKELCEK